MLPTRRYTFIIRTVFAAHRDTVKEDTFACSNLNDGRAGGDFELNWSRKWGLKPLFPPLPEIVIAML